MRPGDSASSASARALPKSGETLQGKYEIVRLLGEGGMAFVFEANHLKLHQRVAIKMLAPEFVRDAELVARFEREARSVAALRTRHVIRVLDVDATPDDVPFMVMEFLEGRDMDAELNDRRRIPVSEAVDYVLQASAGMLEAHQMGIVHRDLKPANLYLANDGGDRVVKVIDFGISKVVGEASKLTGAGAVLGTVLYMSPEQVRASANVDTRTDIWSLGVILYELIAGRAPWEGSSQQIAASIVQGELPDVRMFAPVTEALARVIGTMLERDPARRYPSLREVIAALAPFAPPGSIGAEVAEQAMRESSSQRRAPALPKKTVPMIGAPAHPPPPSSGQVAGDSGRFGSLAPHSHSQARAQPPAAAPVTPPRRSRTGVVIGIFVGVLGAAGVVLTVGALVLRNRQHPFDAGTVGSAAASASEGASAAASVTASATTNANPPATSSATAQESASASHPMTPTKKDAGGTRTPATPGTATTATPTTTSPPRTTSSSAAGAPQRL